jgi:hypothetical protein
MLEPPKSPLHARREFLKELLKVGADATLLTAALPSAAYGLAAQVTVQTKAKRTLQLTSSAPAKEQVIST